MLHEKLMRGAVEFADRPAIIEAETGRTLTYGAYAAVVQALRRALGDTPCAIAMALPGGIPSAAIWLVALTGGHLLVPLAPDAGKAERAYAAAQHQLDVLIVERVEDAARFGCPEARVFTREECERVIERAIAAAAAGAFDAEWCLPPREGRVCLTTSGSTGRPKGVILTERQIALNADQIRQSHRLTSADRGLCVLPLHHVNAPVVSLCASLLAGGGVVLARRFSRRHFWAWIARHRVTWASLVPTILARLLEGAPSAAPPPAQLRFVRTAAAPLPRAHLLAFERRFGVAVVETYGLSEAAATVTANPVPPAPRKPGSVGRPLGGVRLRICRPRRGPAAEPLRDVGVGEVGEVCLGGPSVIGAYARDAEPGAFADGWLRTGDLGYVDGEGDLYLTGRAREVIIRGGENIAPREVEEVLLADPLIRDVAVAGRPDPIYGQQVVAYVVPRGAWGADQAAAVRARCAEQLSAYKVPQTFVAVRSLPRTSAGKIQRHRLPSASVTGQARHVMARVGVASHSLRRMAGTLLAAGAVTQSAPAIAASVGAREADTPDDPGAATVRDGGKARSRPYLYELDMIRAITALAVVGVHVLTFSLLFQTTALGEQIQLALGSALHFTREVFMFTTAFVLVYSYAGKPFSARGFWRKRGVAVVFPYVAWSLIYLGLTWLTQPPASAREGVVGTLRAVLTGSASYQLYYILLTIQFYVLFPLLLPALPALRRHARLVLLASGALEVVVLALDYAFLQSDTALATTLGSRLDYYQGRFVLLYQFYFILGAVAALYLDQVRAFVRRHGRGIVVGMGVMLAAYLAYVGLDLWVWENSVEHATAVLQPIMVPYSLAVIAFLGWLAARWAVRMDASGRPRGARTWRTLADASFGIYLIHPIFITIAMRYLAPALPAWVPTPISIALVWALVAAAAATLSVQLMRDPLLSRLVGRAAPRAADLGAVSHRGRANALAVSAATGSGRPATTPLLAVVDPPTGRVASRWEQEGAGTLALEAPIRWEAAERSYSTVILRAVAPQGAGHSGAYADEEGADGLEASGVRDAREQRRQRAWDLRRQGWKQKDIAAELGVSPSTVSHWLRREHGAGSDGLVDGPGSSVDIGDQTGEREAVLAGR